MYSSMEIVVLPGNRQVKDSTSREYGGPMQESWENYDRQRRRLNARLGLMVFALLPLPAILIVVGLSPLKMLLAVVSLGMSIGILFPMWWRTKHNPLRASAVEARSRRIAWVCRPGGIVCGVAATLFWVGSGRVAKLVGVAFAFAAALLLLFSYFSDKRAEHELRSGSPLN
jgi:hypothetical protein